jgi:hypothetical protein
MAEAGRLHRPDGLIAHSDRGTPAVHALRVRPADDPGGVWLHDRASGRSYGIAGIVLAVASIGILVAYLVTHPY